MSELKVIDQADGTIKEISAKINKQTKCFTLGQKKMLTLDHLRNCPDPTDCGIKSLKGLTHLKDSTLKRQLQVP